MFYFTTYGSSVLQDRIQGLYLGFAVAYARIRGKGLGLPVRASSVANNYESMDPSLRAAYTSRTRQHECPRILPFHESLTQ